MYYLFGISLALAFLFALNFTGSLFAAVAWRVVARSFENESAQKRARTIFALRIFPTAVAFLLVFTFLIPAYFLFEPYASKEVVTFKIALPASISFAGICFALYRFFGGWLATGRLIKNWLTRAEKIKLADVSIPVFRIKHPFPVIAVVGTFRPRIFIAEQVFDLLNAEELQAAICHENGHLAARDNLKSVLLRFCRDSFAFAPFNRRLARAWAENAESAADEYAAQRGDNQTALNLAAALVKIARVIPHDATPALPAGAFLVEQQTADVSRRVRRLLQTEESAFASAKNRRRGLKISSRIYLIGIGGAVILLAANREFLQQIHLAYESIVALVQ